MFLAVVACGAVAVVGDARHAGPVDSKTELPVDRGVMQRVADFTLKDVASGRPVSLYSFVGKRRSCWSSSARIAPSATSTSPG